MERTRGTRGASLDDDAKSVEYKETRLAPLPAQLTSLDYTMPSVSEMFPIALQHHQAGNLQQAEALYRQILQIDPRHVEAIHLMGVIAIQVGKNELAITYIQEALRLNPLFAAAHNNLGTALTGLRKSAEALACFQQALRLEPDYVDTANNLGLALAALNRLDEAEANYRQLLRRKPDDAEAYNNMGTVLQNQGRLEEAAASYQQAVRLKPDLANAYNNLGVSLKDLGRRDEALASFEKALRIKPDHADAHFNRSMQLLLKGAFAEGWKEYEWRWRSAEFLTAGTVNTPNRDLFWDGSPLRGRSILLHPEQGLGDTLQFVRYAAVLRQMGAGKIVVGCGAEQVRLLSRCAGVDEVVTETKMTAYDLHAYLMSLPGMLGTTSIDRIPAQVPYLDCDPDLVQRWEARLAALEVRRPCCRVGIAWQGKPNHRGDRWRSVPLQQFAPLAQLPGVRLVSLQKGVGREQLEKIPGLAVDLGSEVSDVADTAAVIRCLDLVITIDSAVAHLAGALAAPVWVALPLAPDWRWLLQREDSPWYPTMRLFRHTNLGPWDEVFARIKSALGDFSAGSAI